MKGQVMIFRYVASLIILMSGIIHVGLANSTAGVGQISLLSFGIVYSGTAGLIIRRKYIVGIAAPAIGLLVGVMFELDFFNSLFIAIEIVTISLSVFLLRVDKGRSV